MTAIPKRNEPCPCGSGKKFKNCCQDVIVGRIAGRSDSDAASAPRQAEIDHLLSLYSAGHYAQLESESRSLLGRHPELGFVWKAFACSLFLQGKDSLQASQKAAQLLPDDATVHNDLGVVQFERGQLAEAAASFRRALRLNEHFAEAYNNLGSVYKDLLQFDDAVASYRRALVINADYAEAHSNLAYALLATGRHSEGWREYEYRWDGLASRPPRPITSLPQWSGQEVSAGSRLLVFEEQGFGDKIQFARYLPLALERFPAGVSFVVCGPLRDLFRRSFPGIEILDCAPADQARWQWQCPLISLPLAFGTTLDSIPNRSPYLIFDPAKETHWKSRIEKVGLPAAVRRIGVVWKSGTLTQISRFKGIALDEMSPLLKLPHCAWFSLQKEADPDKAPWVSSGKLIDWSDEFCDFDQTAALLINMDLVISVDTAVAHLAAALGKPTWLLNRHASDWRWMHRREDSPWYPTLRIFTQDRAGDWKSIVERLVVELQRVGVENGNTYRLLTSD